MSENSLRLLLLVFPKVPVKVRILIQKNPRIQHRLNRIVIDSQVYVGRSPFHFVLFFCLVCIYVYIVTFDPYSVRSITV